MQNSKLSIIIPTLNEEANIENCIRSARKLNSLEIIVVDGGSMDKTREVAIKNGAVVTDSPKGRGIQLNRGASIANGDVLLFLHADSIFEGIERIGISRLIEKYPCSFFKLKFDNNSFSTRLVELFANLRARLFSLPYGDQALIIRKDLFDKMGGFKDYPFLEDIEFIRRLKKLEKIRCLPATVIVSSRRIIKGYPLSPILVSLRNVLIALLFIFGVSPYKLLRFYK